MKVRDVLELPGRRGAVYGIPGPSANPSRTVFAIGFAAMIGLVACGDPTTSSVVEIDATDAAAADGWSGDAEEMCRVQGRAQIVGFADDATLIEYFTSTVDELIAWEATRTGGQDPSLFEQAGARRGQRAVVCYFAADAFAAPGPPGHSPYTQASVLVAEDGTAVFDAALSEPSTMSRAPASATRHLVEADAG